MSQGKETSRRQPQRIGPYRVELLLGRGGMGEVYRGYDGRLDRPVALKRVRPEGEGSERRRKRFKREAQALARLSHTSIVQVYDWVENEDGDWIVMELVEGQPLRELLGKGALVVERAIEIARDVLAGLALAHEAGIIHRDLKSENVMITAEGGAKLLDFGLAKKLDRAETETELSLDGQLLGSVSSMAPEQAMGRELDSRTDLFSLGTLIYEMVTGTSPFRGDSPVETLTRICTFKQQPAIALNPEVPEWLSFLIDDLLEKDRDRRPQGAAQILSEIETVLTQSRSGSSSDAFKVIRLGANSVETATDGWGQGFEVPTSFEGAFETPSSSVIQLPTGILTEEEAKKSKGLALFLGLALLAILALSVWQVQERAPEPRFVAVASPQVTLEDAAGFGKGLIESGAEVALVRALLARQGLSVTTPELDQTSLSAKNLADALAVDEVMASLLECSALTCRVRLERLSSKDGSILWTRAFDAPADDLRVLSSVIEQQASRAYERYPPRAGNPAVEISDTDYRLFLESYRAWHFDRDQRSSEELSTQLKAIRERSPNFLEADLLAALIARFRYFESHEQEDLEDAFEILEQARELAREDPRPLAQLALTAYAARSSERMDEAVEALRSVDPGNSELLKLQGLRSRIQDDPKSALAALREAARRYPSRSNLYSLAISELELGELGAAQATLQSLLERFPDHFDSRSVLAQVELIHGSPAKAVNLYRALVEESGGLAELANLGLAYLLLERYPEAIGVFSKTVEMHPSNAFLLLNLADARYLGGESDLAERDYRRVLALLDQEAARSDWQALTVRAQALAHLGDIRAAVETTQEALRLAADHPQVFFEAALIYTVVGERTSALVNAEKALEKGFEGRWFDLAWFEPLRTEEGFQQLLANAVGPPS